MNKFKLLPNRHRLGVKILFVGLQDIHPPVKVAGDYEKVVAAHPAEDCPTNAAVAEAIQHQCAGRGAGVYRHQRRPTRRGSSSSWRRLRARRCSPTRFRRLPPRRRSTGSARISRRFAEATANARKYILLVTNTQDVVILISKIKSAKTF